jgi:drug/metabolite transporter (DMT)-like permease
MTHLLALLGVLSISFSAVFIRLASVSPVTAAFFRALYAIPVLAPLWHLWRARDGRTAAARGVAFASGLVLAADLAFWHESIALVGAGLGTVIANVQVVFIAAIGWALYGERPTPRTWLVIAGVLAGVGFTSGLARPDAYGAAPVLGVVFGLLAGLCYSAFLLIFRAANRTTRLRAGPLLDSTCGMAVGALLVAPLDRGFSIAPSWPAHGWLALLAIVAQVIGWLLIASALTRLPPLETSILLLVQPVFALVWGKAFFDERLSAVQWFGTGLVLGGVAMTSGGRLTREASPDPHDSLAVPHPTTLGPGR